MLYLVMGALSFGLFFLSDVNDAVLKRPYLRFLYPLGTAGILAASALPMLERHDKGLFRLLHWQGVIFLTALLCFALVVYALFFALPLLPSYAKPGQERKTNDFGVYALCRHPAALFLAAMYLFFWLSGALGLSAALLYAALNTILVVFEDVYVFPKLLTGYDGYRKTTPFLIPNGQSVTKCIRDLRGH